MDRQRQSVVLHCAHVDGEAQACARDGAVGADHRPAGGAIAPVLSAPERDSSRWRLRCVCGAHLPEILRRTDGPSESGAGRVLPAAAPRVLEGLESERGIAWRAADSLALRDFLGLALHEAPPDHSTISRTRRLIDLETHQAVFVCVLECLAAAKLLKGTTLGLDGTTLEANAALRSIVRRDTGEGYQEFLTTLAKASEIGTPTRADLARIDRRRKKKGSNDDWTHPHDPDDKITKMKDGRTHLAHKAEHAVDRDTGLSWP